jgi:hypothetical protein
MPVESWTTLADLRVLSLKAWSSGSLLRELLEPTGLYPRRRPLKRPTAAALLRDYAAARAWASELIAAAGPFSLRPRRWAGAVGSNRLPAAAVFESAGDEVGLPGKPGMLPCSWSLPGAWLRWTPLFLSGCCGSRSSCWTSVTMR